jgi:SNF2 family DNA or RNA helicase
VLNSSVYPPTKTKPWDHQIEAWNRSKGLPAYYFALDMGTGKSKCAIDNINGHGDQMVLIVCPKSVIPVWPKQFSIHSNDPFDVLHLPMTKSPIKKKLPKIKQKLDAAIISGSKIAFVVNYESFWRDPLGPKQNKYGQYTAPGFIMSYNWDVLILDEAHRIKQPGGKAAWGAKRLASKIPRKLFLSGTPMPHSPLDIYAQFRALDPSIFGTNFNHFRQRYAVMGGYEMKQVISWQNEDELHNKFYSIAYRVKKEDVLDLPPFMDEDREFDLCPAARKVYKTLKDEFIVEITKASLGGLKVSVSNALTKMLRLTQMTCGITQLDDGRVMKLDSGKIDEIKDILTDLPPDEPVVIACRFKQELANVKDLCKKLGRTCGELSGRINEVEGWQNGKSNCLAVNIRSGREGIDLTRAAYCIFSSTGLSLGDYLQFRQRLHRPGQTRPVTYYHILAKNTVDKAIRKALIKREEVVESVLSDIQSNP